MLSTFKALLRSISNPSPPPLREAPAEGRFIDPRILRASDGARSHAGVEADSSPAASPAARPVYRPVVERTVAFKHVGDRALEMTVFRTDEPGPPDEARSCIVFFHGGGWRRAATRQFAPFATELAYRGIVAMCAEYRLLADGEDVPREAVADARSALRWVRANARELGIDPDRLAAAGGSSGAHLALMTALGQGELDDPSDDLAVDPGPDALILLNAPLDFDDYVADVSIDERHRYSPHHLLTAALPPTIVMHGTEDPVIPYRQVTRFKAHADELGVTGLHIVPFLGRTHGFFNKGKGESGDYQRVLGQMGEFLEQLGWLR
jgi:acetyl esterase/lipase